MITKSLIEKLEEAKNLIANAIEPLSNKEAETHGIICNAIDEAIAAMGDARQGQGSKPESVHPSPATTSEIRVFNEEHEGELRESMVYALTEWIAENTDEKTNNIFNDDNVWDLVDYIIKRGEFNMRVPQPVDDNSAEIDEKFCAAYSDLCLLPKYALQLRYGVKRKNALEEMHDAFADLLRLYRGSTKPVSVSLDKCPSCDLPRKGGECIYTSHNENAEQPDECWQAFVSEFGDYADLENPNYDTPADAKSAWSVWQFAWRAAKGNK